MLITKILTYSISLTLGCATTIAIACACALWSSTSPSTTALKYPGPWPQPVPDNWNKSAILDKYQGFGIKELTAEAWQVNHLERQDTLYAGFPFLCLYKSDSYVSNNAAYRLSAKLLTGKYDGCPIPRRLQNLTSITTSSTNINRNYLPNHPLWLATSCNTTLYAILWYLTIRSPVIIRTWHRKRRNLCVNCGYDLRGSITNNPPNPQTSPSTNNTHNPPKPPNPPIICPECGNQCKHKYISL